MANARATTRMIGCEHRSPMLVALLATAGMAAFACATNRKALGEGCDLRDRDSTFRAAEAVYRDCAVDRPAKRLSNARPDFRPVVPRTTCYSVDLEFVVGTSGRPEVGTAQIVRTNDRAFADAVIASLNGWKYEPALRQGYPVRQIVSEHYSMSSQVVVAPAGAGPPSRGATPPPPRC